MGEEVKQEQAKAEEKKEEKVEEKKEEKPAEEVKEEPKPPSPFVLYVDLHCVGCAKKLEKSIMRIRGVEGITIDMAQNQVTIKGIVEPQAVCAKIMKKTKRRAKVLSPLPATEGEPMPEVVASQVSGLTTVELSVNMHCDACAEQLKKRILKMRGVRTVVTELSTEKVTVTGTMDANKLVDYVYRHTKKQAKIVPQPEPEPQPEPQPDPQPQPQPEPQPEPPAEEKKAEESKQAEKPAEEEAKPTEEKKDEEKPQEEGGKKEEKKEENINDIEEENMKRMMYVYQPVYVIEQIPPPQLFSDENPNACTIS